MKTLDFSFEPHNGLFAIIKENEESFFILETVKENIEGIENIYSGKIEKYVSNSYPKIEITKVNEEICIEVEEITAIVEFNSATCFKETFTRAEVETILQESKKHNLAKEQDFM